MATPRLATSARDWAALERGWRGDLSIRGHVRTVGETSADYAPMGEHRAMSGCASDSGATSGPGGRVAQSRLSGRGQRAGATSRGVDSDSPVALNGLSE